MIRHALVSLLGWLVYLLDRPDEEYDRDYPPDWWRCTCQHDDPCWHDDPFEPYCHYCARGDTRSACCPHHAPGCKPTMHPLEK